MGFVKAGRDRRDSRWDAHREQRRVALVGSAIGAIRRHGAGIGMDEIAASAETSKTVIYRHFGDRAGLYTAICESVAGVLLAEVRRATAEALSDAGRGPRAAVAAGIDAYLRLIEIDPELYRFVVQRPLLTQGTTRRAPTADTGRTETSDPVNDLVTVIGDEVAVVIAGNLGTAAGTGTDPRAAARIWGHAIVGLVRGAADDWLARPDGTPRERIAAHLTDLAWSGLSGLASHVQQEVQS
ncbi:TetR/AcrR family transcriptional regulator [Pseudonocardia sp. DR1-2]|uniref:TetR family transcriptional regulator n=1 Tax=Pseudonocardia sp. DR1-2 TaxID=2951168 RepID=UPI0020445764|nr:TetR family transcriptional regulator [Pseudonocardia sp. DR1-2]MCM3846215.1 TetR/AcrR family transcriptional regulator [Pseudonocardia sp. DR1-2]